MYIKKLKIGNVELENNLILAPMAGVTDLPFRMITKKYASKIRLPSPFLTTFGAGHPILISTISAISDTIFAAFPITSGSLPKIQREEDAKKMFEETGCDGIMIGRGTLGNLIENSKNY